MLHIVLYQPEIPQNTGNISRTAAATRSMLHTIKPMGFSLDEKHVRRAGLDYHEYASVQRHANWQEILDAAQPNPQRLFALTTKGTQHAHQTSFQPGDWLLFGRESAGLPPAVRESIAPAQRLRLPMLPEQRSLNLSNAVAVIVFEAWRQCGFAGSTNLATSHT